MIRQGVLASKLGASWLYAVLLLATAGPAQAGGWVPVVVDDTTNTYFTVHNLDEAPKLLRIDLYWTNEWVGVYHLDLPANGSTAVDAAEIVDQGALLCPGDDDGGPFTPIRLNPLSYLADDEGRVRLLVSLRWVETCSQDPPTSDEFQQSVDGERIYGYFLRTRLDAGGSSSLSWVSASRIPHLATGEWIVQVLRGGGTETRFLILAPGNVDSRIRIQIFDQQGEAFVSGSDFGGGYYRPDTMWTEATVEELGIEHGVAAGRLRMVCITPCWIAAMSYRDTVGEFFEGFSMAP